MQILILMLSALAVVLAGAALILVLNQRKSNEALMIAVDERFKGMAKANQGNKKALLQYVDQQDRETAAAAEKLAKDMNGRMEKLFAAVKSVNTKAEEAKKAAKENADKIADLEQGIIPDFETARKAADEVNKFNEGIAGILGFDPFDAIKRNRKEDN